MRGIDDGIHAPEILPLSTWWALQDVYRSLRIEILGEQACVGGGSICRWMLLFQEYDFEVIVKLGRLNASRDHLSRIENGEEPTNLKEGLPDTQLHAVHVMDDHFKDIIHFLTTGIEPQGYLIQQKKELVVRMTFFLLSRGNSTKWETTKYYEDMYPNLNKDIS